MAAPNVTIYMARNGIKRKAVCDKLGLSYQGLKNKTEGESELTASELIALSKWWKVSTDYLLGLRDD